MKIVNVGYDFRHSADFQINRPFGSGDNILLLLRSKGYFVLNGERVEAEAGNIILFTKGVMQNYGSTEDSEFINDWVHFDADDAELEHLADMGFEFNNLIRIDEMIKISALFREMYNEKYSGNSFSEECADLYLQLIFCKVAEKFQKSEAGEKYREELQRIRTSIYNEPWKEWSIDGISKKLLISRSYLQHLYKKYFGIGIVADVTMERMEYAKFLLASTKLKVAEIGKMCGYKTDEHFLRTFKAVTSLTPMEFRKSAEVSAASIDRAKEFNPYILE